MSFDPPAASSQRGEIETELADGRVLITRMRGFITATLCQAMLEQFRRHAVTVTAASWIIDTLDITGFHPGAVSMGARWFDLFKQQGGSEVIVVSAMGSVRMAAATLAFTVRIKVTHCRELTQAYEKSDLGRRSIRPSEFSLTPPGSGRS